MAKAKIHQHKQDNTRYKIPQKNGKNHRYLAFPLETPTKNKHQS